MKGFLLSIAYALYRVRWWVLREITVGVRLMMVEDGHVTLVRHTYQDGWHFPGGGIKRGEMPYAAAVREAEEEAGAQILDELRLLGVYSSFVGGQSNHVFVFVSEQFRMGVPTDRWEIAERGRFPVDDLPAGLTSGYRRCIDDYLAGKWATLDTW
jgi:8-oxo-dGTP pyrophosphatase MutT (NUDIX family)